MNWERADTGEPIEPADVIREKHPEATDREIQLFEFLVSAWPYIPADLYRIEPDFKPVKSVISEWLEATYGWRLVDPPKRAKGRTA